MKYFVFVIFVFLSACTTERTKEAALLKPITSADKSKCKFIRLITEDASGRGSVGRNSKSAMNNALNEVAKSGGDSFFYVSSNATAFGSTVILESYKCSK